MASLNLSPDEMKALEATRNRLYQLTNSIGSLKNDLYQQGNPLPTPTSLQTSAHILQQNLAYLLDILNEHSALLQRVVVHPSTNYPGRTQENVLMQLLRKKLEPDVETLLEQNRDVATAAGISADSFVSKEQMRLDRERERLQQREADRRARAERYQTGEDDEEEEDDEGSDEEEEEEEEVDEPAGFGDFWADSREFWEERVGEYKAQREEDDEDESEEEEEDTVMGGVPGQPGPPGGAPGGGASAVVRVGMSQGEDPERMLWFAARGDNNMPPNIELEAQRIAREANQKKRMR